MKTNSFKITGKRYWGAICTLIVLTLFFTGGIHALLFFVPDKWGWIDADGDWRSAKNVISGIAGLLLSLYLLAHLPKLFLRSKLIDMLEYGSNKTELEKYEKNRTLGEYAETYWAIEEIEKKRKEHDDFKLYLKARKKELENNE